MEQKPIGFIVACKTFFGMKDGQSLADFKNEITALTPQDRLDLIPGLEAALGVKITPPSAS